MTTQAPKELEEARQQLKLAEGGKVGLQKRLEQAQAELADVTADRDGTRERLAEEQAAVDAMMERIEEAEKITSQFLKSPLPEAPASFNFHGTTRKGWNLQFTMRDRDEFALLDRFGKFVARLEEVGISPAGHKAEKPGQPAPPQLRELPGLPASVAPPVPVAGNGSGIQTIHAVRMEVTPQADGKAKLAFYGEGHQYPDITSTQVVDRLLALLAPSGGWTAAHLAVAQKFDVAIAVDWRPSQKLNQRGQPYKDIVAIRPA